MGEAPFVACIGARSLAAWLRTLCESYGQFYAEQKIRVATGNAVGADQAFALGASLINPALVDLYLPWLGYEEEGIVEGNRVKHVGMALREHWELAKAAHPTWQRLSEGVRKLMVRNAMIIRGMGAQSALGVIAVPDQGKSGLGGTGHGMRIARLLGLEVLVLPEREVWRG